MNYYSQLIPSFYYLIIISFISVIKNLLYKVTNDISHSNDESENKIKFILVIHLLKVLLNIYNVKTDKEKRQFYRGIKRTYVKFDDYSFDLHFVESG